MDALVYCILLLTEYVDASDAASTALGVEQRSTLQRHHAYTSSPSTSARTSSADVIRYVTAPTPPTPHDCELTPVYRLSAATGVQDVGNHD